MHLLPSTAAPVPDPDPVVDVPALHVVGAAAGMPRPGWPSSGYLLQTPEGDVLLDCGPGVAGVASCRPLVGVVVTHLHVDHCLDVLVLGKSLAARPPGPRIPLHLPPGGADALRAVNRLLPLAPEGPGTHPTDDVLASVFDPHEMAAGRAFRVGPVEVEPVLLRHRQPDYGLRLALPGAAGPIRLAYTGDTGDTEALVALADGVDLLLAEATLSEPDTSGHGHLSAAQAGARARQAGAGRLLLTHFPTSDAAWLAGQRDAARAAFGAPVALAVPSSSHLL